MCMDRTERTCEECNSHIISYYEDGQIISECSYCGLPTEEIEIDLIHDVIEDE